MFVTNGLDGDCVNRGERRGSRGCGGVAVMGVKGQVRAFVGLEGCIGE